jgi:hypothetical protein
MLGPQRRRVDAREDAVTSGPYGDADPQQGYQQGYPTAPGPGFPGGYGGAYSPPPAGPPQPPYGAPPPGYGYPVGGYGYGYPRPRNGVGTAGLVLGIIGLVLCWLLWVGWVLNILAIILGGVGVSRANHGTATNKGSAMAGLILGIIGLVLGIGLWVALGAVWSSVVWSR